VSEDRVDGRHLRPFTEPGSDALLLLGLILLLRDAPAGVVGRGQS
jgi:hypothetical protein